MAEFQDLEELGIEDDLSIEFTQAANHLQTIAANLDSNKLLLLYGYYKQGLEGPCCVPKPSWYDMRAKSKWEAWNKLGNLAQNDAKIMYINLIQEIDPNFKDAPKMPKETWVTVSTLQNHDDNSDVEKNLIDFIKEGDYVKVVDALKEYRSDELASYINALDEAGLGLIHWAADRGSTEILKTLISYGADKNLCDNDGQTPLHYAASCGHIECIEYLLEIGADAGIKDNDGIDCLAAASDECVKTLIINYQYPKL